MSNRTERRVRDPRHLTRDAHVDCGDRLRARTGCNLLDEGVQRKVVLKGIGFPDNLDDVVELVRILVLLLHFGAVPGQFSTSIVPRRGKGHSIASEEGDGGERSCNLGFGEAVS